MEKVKLTCHSTSGCVLKDTDMDLCFHLALMIQSLNQYIDQSQCMVTP